MHDETTITYDSDGRLPPSMIDRLKTQAENRSWQEIFHSRLLDALENRTVSAPRTEQPVDRVPGLAASLERLKSQRVHDRTLRGRIFRWLAGPYL